MTTDNPSTPPGDAESPLRFPCRFPIKAIGRNQDGFDALVVSIVRNHVDDLAISTRPGRGDNYLAVTVTIEAHSREQLDAIYRELSGHPRVLLAL